MEMLSNWFSKNRAVDQYRRYRLAGKELNHKIMRAFVDDAVIETAARTLGLWKQKRLVLGTEDDTSVLMDFGLYEVPRQGRQLIKRYQEEKGGSNEVERDLLAAMIEATTGLFEVKQIYRRKCQLDL